MKCALCKVRQRVKAINAKYCLKCREQSRKQPKSTLTKAQIRRAESLVGKMPRDDIAETLGVSVSNLKRAFRGKSLWFHNRYAANPGLVKRVCKYYESHGKKKTQEKFKDLNIRAIIERYPHKPRQTRWTHSQKIELLKMAGLVEPKAQAEYFNRPGASEGSIKSVWVKVLSGSHMSINGMSYWNAKFICESLPPYVKTKGGIKIVLWCDLKKHLIKGLPKSVTKAVDALNDFQVMLFGKHPKRQISKILKRGNSVMVN